jgi:Ca2+/H+ antiporter, TMEM165/GDT1 family
MNILVILATFLAAGVEWVEALTIVLAVGLVRGWRSAFTGTIVAVITLVALVAAFGLAITSHISIDAARTVVGVFLLLFGLKWLHKAVLRSSGVTSLHDEAKIFAETQVMLGAAGGSTIAFDRVGVTTSFSGVFLEGLEVVFIVVALGGLQDVGSAVVGAVASLVVVAGAGFALRHPLTLVPENAMKYVVGIMLTSFGTFFAGEGIGVQWPGNDLSLLPLIAGYAVISLLFVGLLRRPAEVSGRFDAGIFGGLSAAVREVWGLFVDDGAVAIVAVSVLLGVTVFTQHFPGQRLLASLLLAVGIAAAAGAGLSEARKRHRAVTPIDPAPAPSASPVHAHPQRAADDAPAR